MGLARLEISINVGALRKYIPTGVSIKTVWHLRIQAALTHCVDTVLNNEVVRKSAFNRLSIPTLIGLLCSANVNLMIVGRTNSWMVNASTMHDRHFIGTHIPVGLT